MRPLTQTARLAAALLLLPLLAVQPAFGWGADGHMLINRLAGAALPADVPAFLRTPAALDALQYYGPEPDRWRSPAEPELNAAQAPEHFIDLEYADLIGPLPRRRYDYIRALAAAQAKHPDLPLTPEKVGLQPYVTDEVFERLESAFRDYRALVAAKMDTKPSEAEIIFLAGWLGHYVGDGANPLHTTKQYNGWVGDNPKGYTTAHDIHSKMETAFVTANLAEMKFDDLVNAPKHLDNPFEDYIAYLRDSQGLVETAYQIEKDCGYEGKGTKESRDFIRHRLAAGAQMLANMWYTAWIDSATDPEPYHARENKPMTCPPDAVKP